MDIGRLPRVLELLLKIQNNFQGILRNLWFHLKRYRQFKNLWRFSKEKSVEAFAAKNPPVNVYDDKMSFYTSIQKGLTDFPAYRQEGCIRLNMRPLLTEISRHAREWVVKLGQYLSASTKELNSELDKTVSDYERDLRIIPRTVDELKFVFLTVQSIADSTIDMEARYRDLLTRYSVLRMYDIEVSEEEVELLEETWKRWQSLWLHEIKIVQKKMEPIKGRFMKITKIERNKFKDEVLAFVKRYYNQGPGTVGPDLEKGLELLEQFHDELKEMEKKKTDMANSEKLFGLEFTLYPELAEVAKDLEVMDILFKLYIEQKEARTTWSQTLWVNLNPNALVDGIEEYLRRFKALPKEIRVSEVGKNVEEKMKEFKRSVPLFVDLKHEALRPRHWQQLMNKTGVIFDMAPDRFTLGKLFAMELHRFDDVIAEIIAMAVKELYIEKCIKELTETWDNYKLNIIKYLKNNEDRGFIVGPMEDMMQILDDNMVTVQGISGSRFVGPFFTVVDALEKTLSTISEVMEAWFMVQRKWMYLEGIFMAGDIREQLAEEAKRFEAIDRSVRTVRLYFTAHALQAHAAC